MKISHRLYLTAAPSVIGVLAVAGLAYWGQYAHAIPELLLGITALAVLGSVILSWRNARYVAQRIERLAGTSAGSGAPAPTFDGLANALMPGRVATADELDTIEGVVDHLSSAVAEAEARRSRRQAEADRQVTDYATMLIKIAGESTARLEEVRLPLHILLENHFGDLNENQEEMLGAARAAAEAVDADLIALRQIAELDLGVRELRRDRLLPADLVRSLVPTLQANADQRSVSLAVDLEPLVPAIRGDQPQLQDALATLLGGAIREAVPGSEVRLSVARADDSIRISATGGGEPGSSTKLVLAARTILALGGTISTTSHSLAIDFPRMKSIEAETPTR